MYKNIFNSKDAILQNVLAKEAFDHMTNMFEIVSNSSKIDFSNPVVKNYKYAIATKFGFSKDFEKSAENYYVNGIIHFTQDMYASFSDFSHAIKIKPNFANAYYARGVLYANIGKFNEAISDFSNTIKADKNFSRAYVNRGIIYLRLGNYRKALEDFNYSISIGFQEMQVQRLKPIPEKYIEDEKESILAESKNFYANSYYRKAIANYNLKKYLDSLSAINQAISYHENEHPQALYKISNSGCFYDLRGCVYLALGKEENALHDFNLCIQIQPEFDLAYFHKGKLLIDSNLGEAEKNFNRFFAITNLDSFLSKFGEISSVFSKHFDLPLLMYRRIKYTLSLSSELNLTLFPLVSEVLSKCKNVEIYYKWIDELYSNSEKTLEYWENIIILNFYHGDYIESFHTCKNILSGDSKKEVVSRSFLCYYYFIESAKKILEPIGSIKSEILQKIKEYYEFLKSVNNERELYYIGQILLDFGEVEQADKIFNEIGNFQAAKFMQLSSAKQLNKSQPYINEIINKLKNIPSEASFLNGIKKKPLQLSLSSNHELLTKYANYRELQEVITMNIESNYNHINIYDFFSYDDCSINELAWLIRENTLKRINTGFIKEFEQNIQVKSGKEKEQSSKNIEKAFNEQVKIADWIASGFNNFMDFENSISNAENSTNELANFFFNNSIFSPHSKLILTEYFWLKNQISLRDVYLLYFYIPHSHSFQNINEFDQAIVGAVKKALEIAFSPTAIVGKILTTGAANALSKSISNLLKKTKQIEIDITRSDLNKSEHFEEFKKDFLKFLSFNLETLGKKFNEIHPLQSFDDYKK